METETANKYEEIFRARCTFSTLLIGFVAGYFLFPKFSNFNGLINLLLGFSISTIGCVLYYFLYFRPIGKGRLFKNWSEWRSDSIYIPIGVGAFALGLGVYFLLFRLPADWAIATVITFPGVFYIIFMFGLICLWTASYSLSVIPVLIASAIEFILEHKNNNTG